MLRTVGRVLRRDSTWRERPPPSGRELGFGRRRSSQQRRQGHRRAVDEYHRAGDFLTERRTEQKKGKSLGPRMETGRRGERQGEVQVPSATSRPVPLRAVGLEDRDIGDRSQLPKPVCQLLLSPRRLVFAPPAPMS